MKLLYSVILLLSLTISCTQNKADWTSAKNKNSVKSYRKFIFFSTNEEKVFAAKLRLEKLLFHRLLSSKGVAAVITFLHEFPKGKHHKQARLLLEKRRAIAAIKTQEVWPLIRILHYHRNSPSSKKIKTILEKRWWIKIKLNPTGEKIRRFLDFFPNSKFLKPAREILAELDYKTLGKNPDPEKVRLFAIAFSETKYGNLAKQDLNKIRNIEILITGSFKSLVKIVKNKVSLPQQFLKISLKRHFNEAVYDLDHKKLKKVCELSSLFKCDKWQESTIKRWENLKGNRLKSLKNIVQKARSWRPLPSISSLAVALESDDLRTVWIALDSLAWMDSPLAFFLIISKIGIPRWEIAWMAESSLFTWFKRDLIWSDTVIQYEFSRIKRKTGEFRYLLRALILANFLKVKTDHLSQLMKLSYKKENELQLKLIKAQYGSKSSWKSVIKILIKTLSKIKMMFPEKINNGNFLIARRLARRIFALKTKISTITPPISEVARIKVLSDQSTSLESKWDKLLREFNNYESSTDNPINENIATWNRSRHLAQKRLKARRGQSGKFWKSFFSSENKKPDSPTNTK
jgi:hypothetical protein